MPHTSTRLSRQRETRPGVRVRRNLVAALAVAGLMLGATAPAIAQEPEGAEEWDKSKQVVSYEPTPIGVVFRMLELADVSSEDVVVDLGSGDGRVPIAAAARYGARGIGYEIQPYLVEQARQNARESAVADRVSFYQQDLFEADLRQATVVTLFLWEDVNVELRPKLIRELPPGTPIISHYHSMGAWEPDTTVEVPTSDEGYGGSTTLYRWYVPEDTPRFE